MGEALSDRHSKARADRWPCRGGTGKGRAYGPLVTGPCYTSHVTRPRYTRVVRSGEVGVVAVRPGQGAADRSLLLLVQSVTAQLLSEKLLRQVLLRGVYYIVHDGSGVIWNI